MSGKYTSKDKFGKNDLRTVITQFKNENIEVNQPLLELIDKFDEEKNFTKAKIALAWILKCGNFIAPITGMRN